MKFQLSVISARASNSFVRVYGNLSFPDNCTCFPFPSAEARLLGHLSSLRYENIYLFRLRYVFCFKFLGLLCRDVSLQTDKA